MASASRIDSILAAILPLVAAAITANEIAPPTSARFPAGWPLGAGWPPADGAGSIKYACDDGGYVVAVNAVEPSGPSRLVRQAQTSTVTLLDGTTRNVVSRRYQRVQITVWSGTETLRDQVADAIIEVVATNQPPGQWVTLPDGTGVLLRFAFGPRRIDESIGNGQVRRSDIGVDADYSVLSAPQTLEPIDETTGIITFPSRTTTVTD